MRMKWTAVKREICEFVFQVAVVALIGWGAICLMAAHYDPKRPPADFSASLGGK